MTKTRAVAEKPKPKIEINPGFRRALDTMEGTSRHVFITGKAGTGKSTLLELWREQTLKRIAVLAPTGVAALNVRGQTVHSFFGFKPDVTPDAVRKLAKGRGAAADASPSTASSTPSSSTRCPWSGPTSGLRRKLPAPQRPAPAAKVRRPADDLHRRSLPAAARRDFAGKRALRPRPALAPPRLRPARRVGSRLSRLPRLPPHIFPVRAPLRIALLLLAPASSPSPDSPWISSSSRRSTARATPRSSPSSTPSATARSTTSSLPTSTAASIPPSRRPTGKFYITLTSTNALAAARNREKLASLPGRDPPLRRPGRGRIRTLLAPDRRGARAQARRPGHAPHERPQGPLRQRHDRPRRRDHQGPGRRRRRHRRPPGRRPRSTSRPTPGSSTASVTTPKPTASNRNRSAPSPSTRCAWPGP